MQKIMVLDGGSYGRYRVMRVEGMEELGRFSAWRDAVLCALDQVSGQARAQVELWEKQYPALNGRAIRAGHLFVLGDFANAGGVGSWLVRHEFESGCYYKVTGIDSGSLLCSCDDYAHSLFLPAGKSRPSLDGLVVCKHILALMLWLDYGSDTEENPHVMVDH